jgi:hypothetical protein
MFPNITAEESQRHEFSSAKVFEFPQQSFLLRNPQNAQKTCWWHMLFPQDGLMFMPLAQLGKPVRAWQIASVLSGLWVMSFQFPQQIFLNFLSKLFCSESHRMWEKLVKAKFYFLRTGLMSKKSLKACQKYDLLSKVFAHSFLSNFLSRIPLLACSKKKKNVITVTLNIPSKLSAISVHLH